MIARLLVANRGEIACRIMHTARAMGIGTVAVHSEADAGALHVREADAAVAVGPAAASESYLRIDRILEAARRAGADAVHPGYGFLAENADFAEAVIGAGLVWVGPPPGAIRAMGLKDSAKRLMEEAGLPVTPGYHGEAQDEATLAAEAARIGFPVLIKAAAGGGGKGMRRVDRAEDFAEALTRARSEAEAAFANPRVLVEKFVENPRHIEVQVFADAHGQAVHLFERDCSIQRRHQKVIEEAPAPGMTAVLREAMTGAAVHAAEAVGYVGAGTVEFIVDGGRMAPDAFFFMEMNTRLQVEHPVTEAVTGLDLVEWQLRVAAGEPLPRAQEDIALTGHAVEARLYAEDPAAGFAPRTGKVVALALPADEPGVRVDAGLAAGDRITSHYDPMVAKIVAHAPTRAAALDRLARALAATHVGGVVTNLGFLSRLIADPGFVIGAVDTGLVDRGGAGLAAGTEATAEDLALAAAMLSGLAEPGPLAGWRAWGTGRSWVDLDAGGERRPVALSLASQGRLAAETVAGRVEFALTPSEPPWWQVETCGHARAVAVHAEPDAVTLVRDGGRVRLARHDLLAHPAEDEAGGDTVSAPLPGILRQMSAAPGAGVTAGEVVAVIEAMKMEHALRAPRDGVVAEVLAAPGDSLAEGAAILTLEPET